jgi:cytidylate kinase
MKGLGSAASLRILPGVSELIVTVDGPGGSGKSTVSKEVARRAGLPHLDTGAFYRAATLAALRTGVDLGDEDQVVKVVTSLQLDQAGGAMYLNGEDVSAEIRGDQVTAAVSEVSAHPSVRILLVDHQRQWVADHGGRAVVEGRDIGSVVFPDATVKIYLDASPEIRARRRAIQDGDDPDHVIADLARRDRLDSTRKASPLTVPEGAHVVDTSGLTLDEVVEHVMTVISESN